MWEVWNEPNLTNVWSPKPDPGAYTSQALLSQDSPNVANVSEAGDRLGAVVRGRRAPTEDVAAIADAGGATTFPGSASLVAGLAGQVLLSQDALNVPDDAEAGDRFGASV